MVMQLLPMNAFAATEQVITDAELTEALAIAGLELRTAEGKALTPRGGLDKERPIPYETGSWSPPRAAAPTRGISPRICLFPAPWAP